jgi:hypothetical protein
MSHVGVHRAALPRRQPVDLKEHDPTAPDVAGATKTHEGWSFEHNDESGEWVATQTTGGPTFRSAVFEAVETRVRNYRAAKAREQQRGVERRVTDRE